MSYSKQSYAQSPNDSYFLCWETTQGFEFVVYCESQSYIIPIWANPFRMGVLFQTNPRSRVWADA